TAETEQAWLDWTLNRDGGGADDNDVARRRRLRDVEQAVARRQPGPRPNDPGDPAQQTHRLVFEVKAETMALFRDLQATVRNDLGHRVDDDTLLLEIARRALGATREGGRSPYQVAVSRCDDCNQTRVDAAGQSHPVDEAFAAMANCDAQRLGEVNPRPHVGEPPPQSPKRATQTIPPATRRQVLRRDKKRCVVPGCHNHRFLDLHHVTPRSEGGTHDPDNLATLCGAHHRAAHAGTLVLEGTAPHGFTCRHADGSLYGARHDNPELSVPEPADRRREDARTKSAPRRAP
ncbi:MAG: HNH endonuclease signature motif containing protein, partial [Polyangiaceae bacterium]